MTAMCVGLADGRRQILGLDVPGGIICGMSTGQHSGAWIEAFCDTVLCELELQVAAQFQADNAAPSDGMEVIANLFSVIHQRLERYSSHLVTLGRLDSTERVTLFLLDMAIRLGRPCGQAVFVELPMTREDIADYLGLNTETISRIFTRLKKSKLVQFPSRSSFSIPEPERLERRLPLPVPHHMSLDQLETFLSTLHGHAASFDGVRQ
ncbi:helix-turn-helix domain-containing protein [Roseibium aggregatum]|uniref:Helix-turn-helix domain-containing protein n=1 Tax=Roseibium aggregatum TaxID=187304 RepID=A0A939J4M5_9HYPH|nr:helix-turn-helix domain-containing protein [Roseibium aggregatum]MBN9670859.1 helix-turn-helix domain-containing protein [Roseibium aggregatum]